MKKLTALDWISNNIKSEDLHENMASLGLNKHVQKKFKETDAIDNLKNPIIHLLEDIMKIYKKYKRSGLLAINDWKHEPYNPVTFFFSDGDKDEVSYTFKNLLNNPSILEDNIKRASRITIVLNRGGSGGNIPSKFRRFFIEIFIDSMSFSCCSEYKKDKDTSHWGTWGTLDCIDGNQNPPMQKKYDIIEYELDLLRYIEIYMFVIEYCFPPELKESTSLGLNKYVQKDYSSDQTKHINDFNSAISDDLMSVEEFYNELRNTIPDFDNNDTLFSVRSNSGNIAINKHLDCDDMKHKLYFAFWSFDKDFKKTENAFRISLSIESSVGFVRNVGWNLDRKSWKNFDKAFCDFEESPENGRFFFKTTKRALAQVIEFAKKFAEYGVNIWEESFDFGEQDDTGVFLNMNSVGLRKTIKPSVEKWILNNN